MRHAGDVAAEWAGRVESFTQTHGPRVEEAARKANAKLGALSEKVHGRVGEMVRDARTAAQDPESRQKFRTRYGRYLLIGGAVLLVVVAAGWELACQSASGMADKQIREILAASGLGDSVTIRRITATPFGTVTLNGIDVLNAQPGAPPAIRIASFTLNGLDSSGHIPSHLSFSASGMKVDLLQAQKIFGARSQGGLLLEAGYTSISGKMAGSYELSGNTFSVRHWAQFENAGTYDVSVTLVNVPSGVRDLLNTYGFGSLLQANPLVLLGVEQQLSQVALSDLRVKLDSMDLQKRFAALPDTPIPEPKVPTASLADKPPLMRFMLLGGKMSMHGHPDQPVPLMRPGMFGSQFNADLESLPGLARATHADVSVTTP
ncbi:hypothetical protein HW511_14175 [Asaia siamensis]|uniref:Uncharacterized protein n=1 Tax=Asaia siamensis TaxID=110479 RepID=A0ABQ1MH75_9PROT|nr:hypothetical protein [Asaia siamensis]GBR07037.1 hypothetical protein AA0323_1648 [Asaia siamensis NRIC 0323]GGC40655.1 hypothetical protein GCM10007207_27560 [Asaia siamensis]